jgi:hypothetical protein
MYVVSSPTSTMVYGYVYGRYLIFEGRDYITTWENLPL